MHRKKHMWKMRLVAAGLVAILGISCFQSASASALSKAKTRRVKHRPHWIMPMRI